MIMGSIDKFPKWQTINLSKLSKLVVLGTDNV